MDSQMSSLKDKKIILGVCGSIAAYKGAYLLRELQRKGAEVRVVMTPSATKFVAPLTFSSLSHNQVFVDMFPGSGKFGFYRTHRPRFMGGCDVGSADNGVDYSKAYSGYFR